MTDTPELLLSIEDTNGVWLVTTLNGSAYVIDYDTMTVLRTPNPHDDDTEKNLRQDGVARPLLMCSQVAIGSNMVFILDVRSDGTPTRRETSIAVRIERLA